MWKCRVDPWLCANDLEIRRTACPRACYKEHPDLFERAKRYENPPADEKHGKQFRWCEGKSLDDIAAMPIQPLPIVDESEGCAICHL